MKKQPIIIAVDDDPQVIRAVSRDLRKKYRDEYRVISTASANEALDALKQWKNQGEQIALFLSDQRMPEMQGVDFLEKAKGYFPEAKRVLLTAYSDTQAAIKAINDVQLDYYLIKPWDPPEEKFYPVLDDLLEDWQYNYIPGPAGVRIIGHSFSRKSHELKDFLSANLYPYQWLDPVLSEKARELLDINQISQNELPVIFFEEGSYVTDPGIPEVATRIGLNPVASSKLYDVVIIGAGPAGLAAAVYGASEGLKTLLVEKRAPGGQAGSSSRIENYLGFPKGLSGSELARRAVTQATRFGTELLSPQEVTGITHNSQYKTIHLADGSTLSSKCLVITTGVSYRQLQAQNIENLTGAGIYYGAANTEAHACKDREVYIVGGGNSAGQAAMYLSQHAGSVFIIIRRDSLRHTMSSYLIEQIESSPNIQVLSYTEITEVCGEEKLERVKLRNSQTREETAASAAALFIFIGAKPITEWVGDEVRKDEKGFLLTGRDLQLKEDFRKFWKLPRDPYLLETSIPGVFAAGDVRSGAMNRVASAVGEGAMSISFAHRYLAEV